MSRNTFSTGRNAFGTLAAMIAASLAVQPVPISAQHAGAPHAAHHDGAANDGEFAADMEIVHELMTAHDAIVRTVTNLPNGVHTLTESDVPQVAAYIKEHVASMDERLRTGEMFNMTSSTIPIIFENADRIHTEIEETPTGVAFTQTTEDPQLVAVLQAHAEEVSELVQDGMAAMMRSMRGRDGAAGGPGGPMDHMEPMEHMGPGMHQHPG